MLAHLTFIFVLLLSGLFAPMAASSRIDRGYHNLSKTISFRLFFRLTFPWTDAPDCTTQFFNWSPLLYVVGTFLQLCREVVEVWAVFVLLQCDRRCYALYGTLIWPILLKNIRLWNSWESVLWSVCQFCKKVVHCSNRSLRLLYFFRRTGFGRVLLLGTSDSRQCQTQKKL